MKKFFSNFKKRDIIVVLITIIALALLFVVIKITRKQERINQQQLVENSIETTETVENGTSAKADKIIINEVDSAGNIELYNNSSKDVAIGGYVIYAKGKEITIEDSASIKSKGFYTIETGVAFKDSDKNVIKIYSNKEQLVRATSFGKLPAGTSYGCVTDGSYEVGYISSSIGESNKESTLVEQDDIVFSVPSGFYDENFELEISAPSNCKIYYTVDGTIPTKDSIEYTNKIAISRPSSSSFVYAVSDGDGYYYASFSPKSVDRGVVVNAIAVDANGNTVRSNTASYYIGFNNDSDYVNLPVISIEVNPKDMFGFESGIYVPGKSYYDGYIQGDISKGNFLDGNSADARIEYFESTKDKTFAGEVSVSIINDERRGTEQKTLAIKAKDSFPEGTGIDKYLNSTSNSLVLLSGAADSASKIRNYFVSELVEGTSVITRDFQPCIVFIDGEYWGLYTLATNYDARFFEDNFGITDKVITVEAEYGVSDTYKSFYDYVVSTDFSVPANYENVKSMMDVDNYIEFMCANVFIGNTVMNRSISACAFRTQGNSGSGYSDGRWRWAMNNVDSTLGNLTSFLDPYTKGDYSSAIMNTYLSPGIRDNAFFNSLLKSNEFAKDFQATMSNLVENNFTQNRANEILDELDQTISHAVYATNLRFTQGEVNHFVNESNRIKNFFVIRKDYLDLYTNEYIGQKGNVAGKLNTEAETENAAGDGASDEASTDNSVTETNG